MLENVFDDYNRENFGFIKKQRNFPGFFFVKNKKQLENLIKGSMWKKTKTPQPFNKFNRKRTNDIVIQQKQYFLNYSIYKDLLSLYGNNVNIWNVYEKYIGQDDRIIKSLSIERMFFNYDVTETMEVIKLMLENEITYFNLYGIYLSVKELTCTAITNEDLEKMLKTTKNTDCLNKLRLILENRKTT